MKSGRDACSSSLVAEGGTAADAFAATAALFRDDILNADTISALSDRITYKFAQIDL